MEKQLRYAITGPPNVGKSSLFIALTGIRVKTANYPGTTLEIHNGIIKGTDVEVTDLPGILRPANPLDEDEKIAVREIVGGKYDGVVVVAAPHAWREALNIAKFASKFKPVVLVFNMVDVWKPPNSEIELSQLVSTPVIYVSAIKNYGVKKLADLLVRGINASRPTEYVLKIPKSIGFVSSVLTRPAPALTLILSIAFVSVGLLVALVEGVAPWGELPFSINGTLGALEKRMSDVVHAAIPNRLTASFIADGLLGSAVTLASISAYVFVALVLVVLYEESGLIAHLTRGVEKLLNWIGLTPRGAVCLLMGISCNVPAIAGAKVLWGQANRTLTALLIPYMPCAARLAIFASVATAALVNAPYLIPLMVLLPYLISFAAAVTASGL
ncbi:MAG: FeoB small GTPase domain-containing protein, partial [Candidatus Caldarchaeum sp.]